MQIDVSNKANLNSDFWKVFFFNANVKWDNF